MKIVPANKVWKEGDGYKNAIKLNDADIKGLKKLDDGTDGCMPFRIAVQKVVDFGRKNGAVVTFDEGLGPTITILIQANNDQNEFSIDDEKIIEWAFRQFILN